MRGTPGVLGALFLFFLSSQSLAVEKVQGKVIKLLTHESAFGQCMAQITGYAGSADCKGDWISFDCGGDFNDKSAARNFYELAQMSLALEKQITAFVEPTERHSGFCVVKRLDLVR